MSPVRPDLVECWVFRVTEPGQVEFLLVQRAPERIFPGIWQPVTGRLEPGERAPEAALREVLEETGLAPDSLEAFYDLDQVGSFYSEDVDAVVMSVIFAVRVRAGVEPRLSHEHEAAVWVPGEEAIERPVWPPYRDSVTLIERLTADPALARWFELDPGGRRVALAPQAPRAPVDSPEPGTDAGAQEGSA
jgi:8-oxo-dGTP pyrophosphatase MutT (NUDIX family)